MCGARGLAIGRQGAGQAAVLVLVRLQCASDVHSNGRIERGATEGVGEVRDVGPGSREINANRGMTVNQQTRSPYWLGKVDCELGCCGP